ncbi:MAG: hypothetical protein AAFO95_20980, partial [Cyanobacteria bacterium J06600_6]
RQNIATRIFLAFTASSLITVLDSILVAASRDLWVIGRILITIVVMYYVLQGKKWAKWVLLAIFSLVVVLLAALVIALHSRLSTFLVVGSLILIILNLITAGFMVCDRNLADYFAFKRKAVRN